MTTKEKEFESYLHDQLRTFYQSLKPQPMVVDGANFTIDKLIKFRSEMQKMLRNRKELGNKAASSVGELVEIHHQIKLLEQLIRMAGEEIREEEEK